MQEQQLKKSLLQLFLEMPVKQKTDLNKNLALLINMHVCLVFSSFKINLFPNEYNHD